MKILALEFSSPQRSIGIGDGTTLICHSLDEEAGKSGVLEWIERLLIEVSWKREQIDCIAVGLGPGSYTGIRSAIALAQGWQLARNVQVQGISSVECLALEACRRKMFGSVSIVVDAQRNEFCLASYRIAPTGRQEELSLRLATFEQVQSRATRGDIIIGPEANKWFPTAHVVFPTATALLSLAGDRSPYADARALEPIYLRETRFVKTPPPRRLPD